MKIYESVKRIKKYRKGLKFITPYLFCYADKKELRKKYDSVVFWILLEDSGEESGDDITSRALFEISFYRKIARTPAEWGAMINKSSVPRSDEEKEFLTKYGRKKHLSLIDVLDEHVLAALNARHNSDWRLKNIIGFTNGISSYRRTEISHRNKTVKKKGRH